MVMIEERIDRCRLRDYENNNGVLYSHVEYA